MSGLMRGADAAVAAARTLAAGPGRVLLGLAGAPGAGKSTLADAIVAAVGSPRAVVVPMDGFHLAQAELERLGRAGRKGAPDTFDAAGFAALLTRLRADDGETVYAPEFRRAIEEPIANAIPVGPATRLVVVEGNYLLHDRDGWERVRALLDHAWFVAPPEALRAEWLLARHVRFGRTPAAARAWVTATDEPNAILIGRGRVRADAVVEVP